MVAKAWKIVKRLAVWTLSGLLALVVVFALVANLRPKAWNTVIVDAGGERVERAFLQMCGKEFPMRFVPGGLEGRYRGSCPTGPTLILESATARFVCTEGGGYNDDFLPPLQTRFRIANGECRYVDEQHSERR